MARSLFVAAVVAALLAGCSGSGSQVPGFCGVSDKARLAVGDADPAQYPQVVAQHVDEMRQSAESLTGDQGALAKRVTDAFEASSKAKPKSLKFTRLYNKFVRLSNAFDHKYCNITEPPDF